MIIASTSNVDTSAAHVFLWIPFKPTNVKTAKKITILLQIATTSASSLLLRNPIANIMMLIPTVTIVSMPFFPAMVININIKSPNNMTSSASLFFP